MELESHRDGPALAYAHALRGNRAEALKHLLRPEEPHDPRKVSPYAQAWAYAFLGETETAVRWLETSSESYQGHQGHGLLVLLAVDPRMAPLRGDSRFEALLRKLKLEK